MGWFNQLFYVTFDGEFDNGDKFKLRLNVQKTILTDWDDISDAVREEVKKKYNRGLNHMIITETRRLA